MDALRWQRIKQLFHDALEYPEERRQDYLVAYCQDDEELLQQVLALLQQDAQQDSTLTTAVASGLQELVTEHFSISEGDQLGAWRITGLIGEGGMGSVFRGQRIDDHFDQQVAIKLIHASNINSGTLQRFHTERQILADLNHPNIAHLLDGGTTEQGLPYLVMEYIDGLPIIDYCRQHRLTIDQRLTLFQQVCSAVEYAHRQLVVHRDIKPANILVTGDGESRLLDFGIAKLIAPDRPLDSDQTAADMRLLTPENAAPEQLLGERITTQTDVYALGNLLFQMLTEHKPFDADQTSRLALERMICEQAPPRPSQTIDADFSLLQKGCDRGTNLRGNRSLKALRHRLRGELDTIVLKALRKSPDRRYASAAALREDIDRFLGHFPIQARPDSLSYRLGKFVRRNRLPLGLGLGFSLALVGFLGLTLLQARQIEQQQQQVQLQAERSNRIRDFMIDIFDAADPNRNAGKTITARALLENGEQRIRQLRDQPLLQAAMLQAIGRVYMKLSEYDKARQLIRQAGGLLAANGKAPASLRLEQAMIRADLEFELGDYPASEASYRQALQLSSQQAGDPALVTDIQLGLVALLSEQQKNAEALPIQLQIVDRQLAAHGPRSAEAGEAWTFLGMLYRRLGRHEASETALRDALRAKRAAHHGASLETAHTLNQLARSLTFNRKYDEALELAREGLEMRQRIHGGPNIEVAASLGNIAHILTAAERYDQAIATRQQSITMIRTLFGDDHPYVAGSYGSLASLHYRMGDYRSAERIFRISIERFEALSPDRPSIKLASPLAGLGRSLLRLQRADEALPVLQRSLEIRKALLETDNWRIADSLQLIGESHLALGQTERAEPVLIEAWRILMLTPNLHPQTVEQTRKLLIALYDGSNRPAMADPYRA